MCAAREWTEVLTVRLIDADELREMFLYETCVFTPNDVLDYIDSTCTINAVPVVRCEDCAKRGTGDCPMERDFPWISSDSDGFCHRGEEDDKS